MFKRMNLSNLSFRGVRVCLAMLLLDGCRFLPFRCIHEVNIKDEVFFLFDGKQIDVPTNPSKCDELREQGLLNCTDYFLLKVDPSCELDTVARVCKAMIVFGLFPAVFKFQGHEIYIYYGIPEDYGTIRTIPAFRLDGENLYVLSDGKKYIWGDKNPYEHLNASILSLPYLRKERLGCHLSLANTLMPSDSNGDKALQVFCSTSNISFAQFLVFISYVRKIGYRIIYLHVVLPEDW